MMIGTKILPTSLTAFDDNGGGGPVTMCADLQRIAAAAVLCIGLLLAGLHCSKNKAGSNAPPTANIQSSSTDHKKEKQEPSQALVSIRSIDFANFSYPWSTVLIDGKGSFSLHGGDYPGDKFGRPPMSLAYLVYGDVTNDGKEDAIVTLSMTSGGSSLPNINYVYALEGMKPKLLWSFYTGDRADGGLRQAYAENGQLVVERYSPAESRGDCCPTRFTRTHYEWSHNRFREKGKEETLANPEGHGSPIMQPYRPGSGPT